MSSRDAILARLRTDAPGPIDAEASALLITPERPTVDIDRLEETFLASLSLPSIAATHDRIGDIAALPEAVSHYLAGHGLPNAVVLPPEPALLGCDWSDFTLHGRAAPNEPAAIAVARCGIAETGSLVFETSPVAPMLPNFLALHHIVLLSTGAIRPYLEDAILPGAQPRAHYWITGVSGTTDIEGTYVRGAHGPRFLHVILLDAKSG